MKLKKKLGLLIALSVLSSSMFVCAQTAYYSNFTFKTSSAYEDKTATVTSATKADNETNWYYRITSVSPVARYFS